MKRDAHSMDAPAAAFGTRIARSITVRTGALLGGVGIAAPIVAAGLAEMLWGRPSSTSGIAFLIAIILGSVGAAVGAFVGAAVENAVRSSPRAGPDWGVVGVLLLLIAGIPSLLLVRSGLRQEALNTPRVIHSTGGIVRSPGESPHPRGSRATLLWSLLDTPGTADPLRWNGHPVRVSLDDARLQVTAGDIRADAVSLADFDYVREIYGVTATLTAGEIESLALLLVMRRSGHRALLLVFDSRGASVHQELLQQSARPDLWVAGPPGRQDIAVDVGRPVHYSAAPR